MQAAESKASKRERKTNAPGHTIYRRKAYIIIRQMRGTQTGTHASGKRGGEEAQGASVVAAAAKGGLLLVAARLASEERHKRETKQASPPLYEVHSHRLHTYARLSCQEKNALARGNTKRKGGNETASVSVRRERKEAHSDRFLRLRRRLQKGRQAWHAASAHCWPPRRTDRKRERRETERRGGAKGKDSAPPSQRSAAAAPRLSRSESECEFYGLAARRGTAAETRSNFLRGPYS